MYIRYRNKIPTQFRSK